MSTTMDTMFETSTGAWHRKEQEERRWQHLPLLLAGLTVALTLAGVIGYHAGNAPVGPLTVQKETLQTTIHTITAADTREIVALQHQIGRAHV